MKTKKSGETIIIQRNSSNVRMNFTSYWHYTIARPNRTIEWDQLEIDTFVCVYTFIFLLHKTTLKAESQIRYDYYHPCSKRILIDSPLWILLMASAKILETSRTSTLSAPSTLIVSSCGIEFVTIILSITLCPIRFRASPETVSYTHLDVYKRQVSGNVARGKWDTGRQSSGSYEINTRTKSIPM